VIAKVTLAILVVVAGPGHPTAAYAASGGVLALAALFFQEHSPLLEASANFTATIVCASLLTSLTFGSLATVAASSLACGVLAALVYFSLLVWLAYLALPWRYLHKRIFKLAELDAAKVHGACCGSTLLHSSYF